MNITFINRLSGIQWGGGESFDLEAATAIRKRGHEVRFIIGTGRERRIPPGLRDFKVTAISTPYLRPLMYRFERSTSRFLRYLAHRAMVTDLLLFELAVLLRVAVTRSAAWTEVYQISGLVRLAACLRVVFRKKAVLIWHGPPDSDVRKWNRHCSATIAFGDTIRAVRDKVIQSAVEIPPGVDSEFFHRSDDRSARKWLRIPDDGIVILFVGRFVPVKNLPLLIRAFERLAVDYPSLYLLLVGDGPERERLEVEVSLMSACGRVRFAGIQQGAALVSTYNASDLLVVSSSYESFSLVSLEAMACGLPVVASRVGGLAELVLDGETGLLFESGNCDTLIESLRRVIADRTYREALGGNAARWVRKTHQWDKTARMMLELYEGL